MGRPIKYHNADDLLANCSIHNDCFRWPVSSTPMPMLSPNAPMAAQFKTTSVMRILFTICRYVPAGRRLVHWCNDSFCVNPFHFSESRALRSKRMKLDNPNGMLPEQDANRDNAAPSDEVLVTMRPVNPHFIKILLDSAVVAGYDLSGMNNKRSYAVPQKAQPAFANPDVPVLVFTKPRPKRDEYPDFANDTTLDDIDAQMKRTIAASKPAPKLAEPHVQHVDSEDDSIFAAIRRREEWLRAQRQKAEQGG